MLLFTLFFWVILKVFIHSCLQIFWWGLKDKSLFYLEVEREILNLFWLVVMALGLWCFVFLTSPPLCLPLWLLLRVAFSLGTGDWSCLPPASSGSALQRDTWLAWCRDQCRDHNWRRGLLKAEARLCGRSLDLVHLCDFSCPFLYCQSGFCGFVSEALACCPAHLSHLLAFCSFP